MQRRQWQGSVGRAAIPDRTFSDPLWAALPALRGAVS